MDDEKRTDILMYTILRDGRECTVLSLMPLEVGFEKGIPSEAILGELSAELSDDSGEGFTPNVAFIKFMHESIATHVRSCPSLIERAKRLGNGQLPLLDGRLPPEQKKVNAEDVIGLLEVEEQRIVRYIACMQHRIVNDHGVMKLDEWLLDRLVSDLVRIDEQQTND
jgi:hypothetical protein